MNDRFADRLPLEGLAFRLEGDTTGATVEFGEPVHGARRACCSLWWSWEAPHAGVLRVVEVQGRAPHPRLAVYIGDTLQTLNVQAVLAADESQTELRAAAGQVFRIAVDGMEENSGAFAFEISLHTLEFLEPLEGERFEDPAVIRLSTIRSGTNLVPERISYWADGAWIGDALPPLFDFDWEAPGAGQFQLSARWTNSVGETHDSAPRTVVVSPRNDSFARAIELPAASVRASVAASNGYASSEPGEPAHAGQPAAHSLWWRWQPAYSGTAAFSIPQGGHRLAVYSGSILTNLVPVAHTANPAAPARFAVEAGSVYFIALDGPQLFEPDTATWDFELMTLLWAAPVPGHYPVDRPLRLSVINHEEDHPLQSVRFYSGETLLGEVTSPPWEMSWTPEVLGPYQITASAVNSLQEQRETEILSVTITPPNDAFADAIELTGPPGEPATAAGTTQFSSLEPGEPSGGGSPRSIWFTWVAGWTGAAQFELEGNASLGIFAGSGLESLASVSAQYPLHWMADVEQGTRYFMGVRGWLNAEGPVRVTVHPPPLNNDLADAWELEGFGGTFSGSNFSANSEPGEFHDNLADRGSIWWRWTAPATGDLSISTGRSLGMTVHLTVFHRSSSGEFHAVWGPAMSSTTDPSGGAGGPGIQIRVQEGADYYLRLSGGSGGFAAYGLIHGEFALQVIDGIPANDLFENRFELSGYEIGVEADNTLASKEPQEPVTQGCGPSGHTLWWTFRPETDGILTARADGPERQTLVTIFRGSSLDSIEQLARSCSQSIFLPVEAGTDYPIAVDSAWENLGPFLLQLRFYPPPSNDHFENAARLTGENPAAEGYTFAASREPDEPDTGAAGTVWWVWNAPVSGRATLTLLSGLSAVFTGASLDALQPLNRVFACQAGTDYYIQAYSGAIGGPVGFTIDAAQLTAPPNDHFANATLMRPDSWGSVPPTPMMAATWEPGEPPYNGSTNFKTAWWRWQAPSHGLTRIGNNGPPMLFLIYTGSALENLSLVAGAHESVSFNAVGGTTYFIAALAAPNEIGDVQLWRSGSFASTSRIVPGNLLREPSFEGTSLNFAYWQPAGPIGGAVNEPGGADGVTWVNIPAGSSLSQEIDTVPGREYRIGFAMNAVGAVRLSWNGELLAALHNPEGYVGSWYWTNYIATASSVRSRVTFDATEGILGLDSVSVVWHTEPPFIETHPLSVTTAPGGSAAFDVAARGTSPLSYQWRFNGTPIEGAAGATLLLENVSLSQAGTYDVTVSNAFGTATSDAAVLGVVPIDSLVIVLHPHSDTLVEGGYHVLSAAAAGPPPIEYQWFRGGAPIEGAATRHLIFDPVEAAHAGTYRVRASNPSETVFSLPASLSVSRMEVPAPMAAVRSFNLGIPPIDAPVFDADGVTRLSGAGYAAQIYAGSSPSSLRPASAPFSFSTGSLAGYFSPRTVALPGVQPGAIAWVQVRAWERAAGESYEEARALGGKFGRSAVLSVQTLPHSNPPPIPPLAAGLESFQLHAGFPEFTTGRLRLVEIRPDRTAVIELKGHEGFLYLVESAGEDLVWKPSLLLTNEAGTTTFEDTPSDGPAVHFYRARLLD